jgi:hypothetical protein
MPKLLQNESKNYRTHKNYHKILPASNFQPSKTPHPASKKFPHKKSQINTHIHKALHHSKQSELLAQKITANNLADQILTHYVYLSRVPIRINTASRGRFMRSQKCMIINISMTRILSPFFFEHTPTTVSSLLVFQGPPKV